MRKNIFSVGCAMGIFVLGFVTGQSGFVDAAPSAIDKELIIQYEKAASETRMFPLYTSLAELSRDEKTKAENQQKAMETARGALKLSGVLHNGSMSPALSRHIISKVVSEYENKRANAKSAVQVSQAADEAQVKMQLLQIAQNQQIISLLQSIDRKTK